MVERARHEVDVMLTSPGLRESIRLSLPESVAPFVRGGGQLRQLLDEDPRARPILARFRRSARRFPGLEIRQTRLQPSRLTIVDRTEALVFLVPEARAPSSDHVAVWTDHPSFVTGHQIYFDQVWRAARPRTPVARPVRPR